MTYDTEYKHWLEREERKTRNREARLQRQYKRARKETEFIREVLRKHPELGIKFGIKSYQPRVK
jgi:hypothetical protein